jgi:hypothetical protein
MDVEADEQRAIGRVDDGEPGLLDRLAPGGLRGRLPRLQVPTGLQPPTLASVAVQQGASGADHHRRRSHVDRVGVLVPGPLETIELGQEPVLGGLLTLVGRPVRSD